MPSEAGGCRVLQPEAKIARWSTAKPGTALPQPQLITPARIGFYRGAGRMRAGILYCLRVAASFQWNASGLPTPRADTVARRSDLSLVGISAAGTRPSSGRDKIGVARSQTNSGLSEAGAEARERDRDPGKRGPGETAMRRNEWVQMATGRIQMRPSHPAAAGPDQAASKPPPAGYPGQATPGSMQVSSASCWQPLTERLLTSHPCPSPTLLYQGLLVPHPRQTCHEPKR